MKIFGLDFFYTIILAKNLLKIRVSKRRTPAKSGSLANKRQARSSSVRASDLSCSDASEWSKLHSERAMRNLPKLSLQASQASGQAKQNKPANKQVKQIKQAKLKSCQGKLNTRNSTKRRLTASFG